MKLLSAAVRQSAWGRASALCCCQARWLCSRAADTFGCTESIGGADTSVPPKCNLQQCGCSWGCFPTPSS